MSYERSILRDGLFLKRSAGTHAEISPFGTIAVKRATLFHQKESDLERMDAVKNAALIDSPDTLGRLAADASKSLAAQSEAIIRGAISKRLGREDWSPDELRGRLEVHHPQNKQGVEAYHLDGLPLVTLYPTQSEGSPTEIRMYRKYKIQG